MWKTTRSRLTHALCSMIVVGGLAGCSDDDAPHADAGYTGDAGPRDAAARDGGDGSTLPDGSTPRDAAVSGKDAELEASTEPDAALLCKSELFPLWSAEIEGVMTATRVPLDALCRNNCPRSLQEYLQLLACEELDDAGIHEIEQGHDPTDGGAELGFVLLRSDGCGSVQFSTLAPSWPRYFNFDASSGELIGAARLDDIFTTVAGTPCMDAAFVAGEIRSSCAGETLMICTSR
jgi:hypothetical protein